MWEQAGRETRRGRRDVMAARSRIVGFGIIPSQHCNLLSESSKLSTFL